MRQLLNFISICCVFTIFLSIPLAQASDWTFSLGAQYWRPDWKYEKEGGFSDEFSESGNVYGPTAFVGFRKFGFGINYFDGSFDENVSGKSESRDRKDLDVFVSYNFWTYLSAFVAYKSLDFEKTAVEGSELTLKTKVDGLALGLSSTFPFGTSNYFGYASAFYMPKLNGDEEWQGGTAGTKYDADAEGYNAEFGIGYNFFVTDSMIFRLRGGYRLQHFSYSFDDDLVRDVKEDYNGFRANIAFIW